MSDERRCYYDILGLDRKAEEDEVRRAYKKAALRCHPDRNHGNEEAAALEFKEVQNAYAVLIDPDERAWYDSHRDAILRGDEGGTCAPDELNVYDYFSSRVYDDFLDSNTKKGFYNVYRGVFETLVKEESDYNEKAAKAAPNFGDSKTPWAQVNSFYVHWKNFITAKTFAWKDEYKLNEISDRQYRREAERINLKVRSQARKEYMSAVSQLVHHVYARDPRVTAERERAEREKEEKAAEREQREIETARRRREANKKIWEEAAEREAKEAEERAARGEDCYDHGAGLEMLYEKQRQMERAAKKGDRKGMREAAGAHCSTGDTSYRSRVVVGGFAAGGDDSDGEGAGSDGEGGNNMKNAWRCLGCKKNFSTDKTYLEHIKSNKHKTKFKQLEKSGADVAALLVTPQSAATSSGAAATATEEEEGASAKDEKKEDSEEKKNKKKGAESDGDDDDDEDDKKAKKTAKKDEKKQTKKDSKQKKKGGNNNGDSDDEDEDDVPATTKKGAKKAAANNSQKKRGGADSDDDDHNGKKKGSKKQKKGSHDSDDEIEVNTRPSAKYQKSKAKAAAAAAAAAAESGSEEEEESEEEVVVATKNKFAFGKKKK